MVTKLFWESLWPINFTYFAKYAEIVHWKVKGHFKFFMLCTCFAALVETLPLF